jgi:hypothetical protein
MLTPHWVNACRVRLKLGALEDTVVSLQAVLDRVSLGVVVIDKRGRVKRLNQEAERILAEGSLISLDRDRLSPRDPRDATRLSSAIAVATHGALEASRTLREVDLLLHDKRGDAACIVNVHALTIGGSSAARTTEASVVVFLRPIGNTPSRLGVRLAEIFDLTPSETRLALALYKATNLESAATALAISLPAARTRLKSIFDKTSTPGQPALVGLIASVASTI